MSSFSLSDFLINFCVFMGSDGADKRSLKYENAFSLTCHRKFRGILTQLNLFSIFNIKNMCLETTSFPCILVPIVLVFLNLDYIQNINRVSRLEILFWTKTFSSHPVCTQKDQRCEKSGEICFRLSSKAGWNFNFPFFTRLRSCSRFNERLADAEPDEDR